MTSIKMPQASLQQRSGSFKPKTERLQITHKTDDTKNSDKEEWFSLCEYIYKISIFSALGSEYD